jgi:hypothetical protein
MDPRACLHWWSNYNGNVLGFCMIQEHDVRKGETEIPRVSQFVLDDV